MLVIPGLQAVGRRLISCMLPILPAGTGWRLRWTTGMLTGRTISRFRHLGGRLYRQFSPALRRQRSEFVTLRREFYARFWRQAAAEIAAGIADYGGGWLQVSRGKQKTFVCSEYVMLDSALLLKLAGNKALVYRLLTEDGYPVPAHVVCNPDEPATALAFLERAQGEVVVKPIDGWGGRGVSVHINSPVHLRRACREAARVARRLLVEEHVEGDSYRLLFLNGEFINAVRRDPPAMTGDGTSTVRALVRKANESRIHDRPVVALNPLTIDTDCREHLRSVGLGLSSVPGAGEIVQVKRVPNQNSSAENHVVTIPVHPEIIAMGQDICRRYRMELAGLDLITADIGRPLGECGGVINELNTTPALHHHVLVSGGDAGFSVGARVLDYLLASRPVIR